MRCHSVAPPTNQKKKTPPRFVIHPFTYFNSSCINKKAQFAPFLPAHTAYLINLVCAETFWYIKKNMLQNKKQKKRKKRKKKAKMVKTNRKGGGVFFLVWAFSILGTTKFFLGNLTKLNNTITTMLDHSQRR